MRPEEQILDMMREVREDVRGLRRELSDHAREDAERHGEFMREAGTWSRGQAEIERRVGDLEEVREITGIHNVEDLKEEVRERRKGARDVTRQAVAWFAGIAATVGGSLLIRWITGR